MALLPRVGRALLATIFLHSGLNSLQDPTYPASKADEVDLPEPETLARIHAGAMVGAGTTMALGILPRLSALVLAGTLVPSTVLGHDPGRADTEQARAQQMIQVAKNMSLLGGLLLVATQPRDEADDDG